jgi:HlyD family secretion protein
MKGNFKWILITVVVVIIALVVLKKMGIIGQNNAAYDVTLAEVENRTIIETVTASGKIQPESEVKISSEVSGEIIELTVKEGQHVVEGQLLVRINPDLYESAVNRARAALNSSKSALAQSKSQYVEAQKNFERNKKLFAEKVISDAEYDAAVRTYEVAKLTVDASEFQLKSAEANVDEAAQNLKRTIIRAPASGTVSKLNVELGERVVGTAQMTGTEMLRVANLEVMEVLIEVNENDIVRLHLGDTAIIEVDAYLDEKFKGVVTEIANSANTTGTSVDQVTSFNVKVRMLRESYEHMIKEGRIPFRPGMTATVDIRTNVVKNVKAVPIQAVTTRTDTASTGRESRRRSTSETTGEEKSFEVVFVAKEGKSALVVVKTGVQDDMYIQITEGLKGDEQIITGPYEIVTRLLNGGDDIKKEEKKDSKGKPSAAK